MAVVAVPRNRLDNLQQDGKAEPNMYWRVSPGVRARMFWSRYPVGPVVSQLFFEYWVHRNVLISLLLRSQNQALDQYPRFLFFLKVSILNGVQASRLHCSLCRRLYFPSRWWANPVPPFDDLPILASALDSPLRHVVR